MGKGDGRGLAKSLNTSGGKNRYKFKSSAKQIEELEASAFRRVDYFAFHQDKKVSEGLVWEFVASPSTLPFFSLFSMVCCEGIIRVYGIVQLMVRCFVT